MNRLKKSVFLLLLAMLLVVSTNVVMAKPPNLPPPLNDLDEEEWRELLKKAKPYSRPPELTEQEKILRDKALSFLTNVAKFDTSRYNIEVHRGHLYLILTNL